MKKIIILLVILAINNSFIYADRPKLYCEILTSNKIVSIQSHLFWNVDENTFIPKSFFSGNDTRHNKKIKLGKNRLNIEFYFPKQENGKRLSTTTTIQIKICINGKELVKTKHFGQHSQDFVRYNTEILPRPDIISIFLDDTDNIQVKVDGKYIPKRLEEKYLDYSEERFTLDYSASSKSIKDVQFAEDILKQGPIAMPLKYVEETLIIGSLNQPAIYLFKSNINNLFDDDPYEWGWNSFLFCTEKTSESKLTDLFNPFMHEYTQFKDQSTIRIFDPNITYYSSEIRFNPKHIIKTGKNSYKLSNLTNNYILVNGVKVLNRITQKTIKISLLKNWIVDSIEVGENTTYKEQDGFIYFHGDGLTKLNYSLSIREKE